MTNTSLLNHQLASHSLLSARVSPSCDLRSAFPGEASLIHRQLHASSPVSFLSTTTPSYSITFCLLTRQSLSSSPSREDRCPDDKENADRTGMKPCGRWEWGWEHESAGERAHTILIQFSLLLTIPPSLWRRICLPSQIWHYFSSLFLLDVQIARPPRETLAEIILTNSRAATDARTGTVTAISDIIY